MPAKTTIFNTRAVATHSFPLAPRNTISFSPHGRFVLVAGFGNLAGQIDIYDGNKDYNKVTTIESGNPSVCEWSPDGVCILTATTSPRLRVDNGVRIWHVSGGLIYNEDLIELYEVCAQYVMNARSASSYKQGFLAPGLPRSIPAQRSIQSTHPACLGTGISRTSQDSFETSGCVPTTGCSWPDDALALQARG